MPVQVGYESLLLVKDTSKNNLLSDNNILSYNVNTASANYLPSVLEKTYTDYYKFVLTSGITKILILEDVLTSEMIDNVVVSSRDEIKYVYISPNCTEISDNCFKDCSNLEIVDWENISSNSNSKLKKIGNSAFLNCTNLEFCRIFDISNVIEELHESAFKNCTSLKQIIIQKSNLKQLGNEVFSGCTSLLETHIISSITNIGDSCFTNSSLVNIYFDSTLPQTIGTNIFSGIPNNSTCYYYGNHISVNDYTSLKQLFDNTGNNTVFVEISNNSIENSNSFYTINNIDISTNIVDQAKQVIDSIIKKNASSFTIKLEYDPTLSGGSTLGYATGNEIYLNPSNDSTVTNYYLNNNLLSLNVVVLVHEFLHIFGIGLSSSWTNYKTTVSGTEFYKGKNGVYQYNKLNSLNNYNKILNYIAIEDSGSSGTRGSHIEEGYRYYNSIGFVPQVRYDNSGNIYPSYQSEIMSGWMDQYNYFTGITCGILQDLGFTINYNSSYIYKQSISNYPSITISNTTTSSSTNSVSAANNVSAIDMSINGFRCTCHNNVFTIKQ